LSYEATVFRAHCSLAWEIYLQEHHKDCLALHYMLQGPPEIVYFNESVNVQALGQLIATNSDGLQVLTDCSQQGAEIADEIIKK